MALRDAIRNERVAGAVIVAAAVAALVWINSPVGDAYVSVRDTMVGPDWLDLRLSVGDWAKDGLLALFFFVVGLELKHELVAGELSRPATALVPVVAAVGGMVVPACLYLGVNAVSSGGSTAGWAVPVATDIAFAVAVLSLVGTHLPRALRTFLLTLAVADDLLAIVVIAVFFPTSLQVGWLVAAGAGVALFGFAVRRLEAGRAGTTRTGRAVAHARPAVLALLALVTWVFMHASGIHATIAGVALAMTVPARSRAAGARATAGSVGAGTGAAPSIARRWEHHLRPWSSALAVPVFAFFAAGVAVNAASLHAAATDPVAHGVVLGLVVGKPLGIVLATLTAVTFTRARMDASVRWGDFIAMACLGGIGFTVSLLIGDLAFASQRADEVKMSVMAGSLASAILGGSLLWWRNRSYRLRGIASSTGDDAVATGL